MFNIKIIAVAGFILGLVAAFVYFDRMGYDRGQNACEASYSAAQDNAEKKASSQIKSIQDKYEIINRELRNVQSENTCVGDHVRTVLGLL